MRNSPLQISVTMSAAVFLHSLLRDIVIEWRCFILLYLHDLWKKSLVTIIHYWFYLAGDDENIFRSIFYCILIWSCFWNDIINAFYILCLYSSLKFQYLLDTLLGNWQQYQKWQNCNFKIVICTNFREDELPKGIC